MEVHHLIQLRIKIEEARKGLHEVVQATGLLTHDEVINQSEELDILINQYQKIKNNN